MRRLLLIVLMLLLVIATSYNKGVVRKNAPPIFVIKFNSYLDSVNRVLDEDSI